MSSPRARMIGRRFGLLKVVAATDKKNADRHRIFVCRCDCGQTTHAQGNNLRNGHTTSCGCKQRRKMTKLRIDRSWT